MVRGLLAPLSSYELTLLVSIRNNQTTKLQPEIIRRFEMLKLIDVSPEGVSVTDLGRQRIDISLR